MGLRMGGDGKMVVGGVIMVGERGLGGKVGGGMGGNRLSCLEWRRVEGGGVVVFGVGF